MNYGNGKVSNNSKFPNNNRKNEIVNGFNLPGITLTATVAKTNYALATVLRSLDQLCSLTPFTTTAVNSVEGIITRGLLERQQLVPYSFHIVLSTARV